MFYAIIGMPNQYFFFKCCVTQGSEPHERCITLCALNFLNIIFFYFKCRRIAPQKVGGARPKIF